MQELTPTSLENVFAELEKETGKLVLVVFKTETSMVDFFNAIADQIYRGELSNVFGGRKKQSYRNGIVQYIPRVSMGKARLHIIRTWA